MQAPGLIEVKAPNPRPDNYWKQSVFLAGSIEMGVAEEWQTTFTKALGDRNLVVLNPRRDNWDKSLRQSIDEPAFKEQVEWELDNLIYATYIIMYFDPKTMSPISLLELGLHADSGKMLVCCPDGFWRKGNVEVVCDNYQIPLYNSLHELIEGFIKHLDRNEK